MSDVEQRQRNWLVEQRYRAVLEVLGGSRVSEVALRYGVSRQAVYSWKAKYEAAGVDGLREASRRPKTSPTRIPAEVEAMVCEMRRVHPRWGARRIAFELGRAGRQPPSRATVHRILERNGLVVAQEQQHRRKYKRWQREAPMHLWQLDLVGGIYLADGRECKMLTGIDDHSRFVVIAAVLAVPSGRAVADAFLAAMRVLRGAGRGAHRQRQAVHRPVHQGPPGGGVVRAGVPGERHHRQADPPVLTDHDREDRTLASDAAPGTAGCRRPVRGPAVGAGGDQRLGARLQPRTAAPGTGHGHPGQPVPAQRRRRTQPGRGRAPAAAARPPSRNSKSCRRPRTALRGSCCPPRHRRSSSTPSSPPAACSTSCPARNASRWVAARGGQHAHVWADENSVHIIIDGELVKTVPSNLNADDLHELRMRGAQPAGPHPRAPRPSPPRPRCPPGR